jgi:hypothetical protein
LGKLKMHGLALCGALTRTFLEKNPLKERILISQHETVIIDATMILLEGV